ncbi:MAG: Hint domain-containing protein [Roseovarius sp.]|nr:Hint domain-containing protein [Roseovarius sp.]
MPEFIERTKSDVIAIRRKAGNPGRGAADRVINCFTPGTLITTRAGKRPVEALRPGDRILTRDRGFQPLLWRGMRLADLPRLDARARPVLIRAGAPGPGQPERDLIVSPRHHLLSTDPGLLRDTGEPEVLVEAQALIGRPGIGQVAPARMVYAHLLMEQHEIILAENCWTESFCLTRSALQAMAAAGRNHFARMLPVLRTRLQDAVQVPARFCPSPGEIGEQIRDRIPDALAV